MEASSTHNNTGPIIIRQYDRNDYCYVLPIWQKGFRELSKDAHRDMSSSKVTVFMLSIAAAALVSGRTLAAASILMGAGVLRSAMGEALIGRLMDIAIRRETSRDMTQEALNTRWAKPGESAFFVAEYKGRVIGCVGVLGKHTLYKEQRRSASNPNKGDEASIWRLSVDASARRLGVGKKLVARVEEWCKEQGYTRISLVCGNTESKRFYERIGYKQVPFERAVAMMFGGFPDKITGTGLGIIDRLKLAALRRRVGRGNLLETAL